LAKKGNHSAALIVDSVRNMIPIACSVDARFEMAVETKTVTCAKLFFVLWAESAVVSVSLLSHSGECLTIR